MALPPISNSALVPAVKPPEATAVRAAQRAFFSAALGKVDAAPAITTAAPSAPARSAQAPPAAAPSESTRPYRPGSRLDIRV